VHVFILSNGLQKKDVASMSRVNRRFYSLCQQFLYEKIEIEDRGDFRLLPLLRTLFVKPELGQLVRQISFPRISHAEEECYAPSSITLPVDRAVERLRIIGYNHASNAFSTSDSDRGEYVFGGICAVNMLILSSCPNLTALKLGSAFGRERHRIASFLKKVVVAPDSVGMPPQAFQQLSKVEFPMDLEEWRWFRVRDASRAMSVFYLPKLKHLSLPLGNPKEIKWDNNSGTPFATELSSLSIHGIREHQLGQVLEPFHQLRSLKWQYSVSAEDGVTISLPALAKSLQKARGLQEVIILAARSFPEFGIPQDLDPPSIVFQGLLDSLATGMESLCKLQIPWVFVMGIHPCAKSIKSVLTPNLEQLTLTGDLGLETNFGWSPRGILWELKSEVANHHPHGSSPKLRQILLTVFEAAIYSFYCHPETYSDDEGDSETSEESRPSNHTMLSVEARYSIIIQRNLERLTSQAGVSFLWKLPQRGSPELDSLWIDQKYAKMLCNNDYDETYGYFASSDAEESDQDG
jgi:hypothetical protein